MQDDEGLDRWIAEQQRNIAGPVIETETDKTIYKLTKQKAALVAYLRSKLEAEDWHAVQDAASDIREIEAVLKAVR